MSRSSSPEDHLGADEAALQVGVDHARRTRAPWRRRGTSTPATRCRRWSGRCAGRAGGTRRGRRAARRPRRARGPRAARRDPRARAAPPPPRAAGRRPARPAPSDTVATSSSTVSSWSSPMFTTASTGLIGEQERGREQLALVVGELGAVERRAVTEDRRRPARAPRSRRRATCRPWPRAAAGTRRPSTDARSASTSSSSSVSRSARGSVSPSTDGSSNARST